MSKNNDPLLIKDSFPDFVKIGNSKQIYDYLQITANVQIVQLHVRPCIKQMLVEVLVGRFDNFEIIKVLKKYFRCDGKSEFEISEHRDSTNNCDRLLDVRSRQF